ncbi:MAG: hypothetical protein LUQ47_04270 [Methanotrichaceae archaeon]|nr:hypothetical protein [Methanotrichaceae archaeon]
MSVSLVNYSEIKNMKKEPIIIASLTLILFACLIGVEGQQYMDMQYPTMSISYNTPSPTTVGYQTTTQTSQAGQTTGVSQYSQYYTMGPALNTHISAPQQFNISSNTPATVYFSYQRQPVAYSQYQSNPTYPKINSRWIKGSDSWAQYAQVPQGAVILLLAISPNGGNGYIREMDPSGPMYNYNYFFYPNSELASYADTHGRHTISFGLAGVSQAISSI